MQNCDVICSPKINRFVNCFEIIPCSSFNKNLSNYTSHIAYSMKILLIDLLDENTLKAANKATHTNHSDDIQKFIQKFESSLPFSNSNISPDINESNVSLTTICSGYNTQGTGRYISEVCSQSLVPGKQIPLSYVFTFVFSFKFCPEKRFLIHQINGNIYDKTDIPTIEKTLPVVDKEIKICISAIQHARGIICENSLNNDEKKQLINQNLEKLAGKSHTQSDNTLFNHIHNLFIKLSTERKTALINEQMSPLLTSNSKFFQRDIFTDLQNFILQFQTNFIFKRPVGHLSKLVSHIYLFKKTMAQQIIDKPNQRHLNLKILNSEYDTNEKEPFVALLICVNILKPNEVIAKKHIEKALQTTLNAPFRIHFHESIDKTNHAMRLLYFEILKVDRSEFNKQELKELTTQLAKSIKVHIKRTMNPVFMAKNEEEILKNVITLSKQLKYVHDIPQMMINFHKQTDDDLIFTVIILRIIKTSTFDIESRLKQVSKDLSLENIKIKLAGYLRKKHQKQASIFDIRLTKKQFLQQDFSVDLYEARSLIYYELSKCLGRLRDFNGGMIFKQHEVYAELRQKVLKTHNADEFTLKNFFYQITPSHMQGVIEPLILQKAFNLLIPQTPLPHNKHYHLKDCLEGFYYCLLISTASNTLKSALQEAILSIKDRPTLLANSSINTLRFSQNVYIFKLTKIGQEAQFLTNLEKSLDSLINSSKPETVNELEMHHLNEKKSSYEIYQESKNSPNLMLNEHF